MGLFGKKKEEESSELPPLQFPELPQSVPNFEEQQMPAKEMKSPAPKSSPVVSPGPMPGPGASMGMEQPLFVRIEKYRDVVTTLNHLKDRLNDADDILAKLNQLKAEEDRELRAWQSDLEKIRNQLLDVDQKLFENG